MAVKPITRLASEVDKLIHRSKTCYYSGCPETPITSHTIAENNLKKINQDLTKVLTLQRRLLRVMTKPDLRLIPVDKQEFSTFVGFCWSHDHDLFGPIDSFDGRMDKEKAALIHYRNICYGISHIKTQQLRERHIYCQNYLRSESPDVEANRLHKALKGDVFANRLAYCLLEHLHRKEILEGIIQSRDFDQVEFITLIGTLTDPIFSGRSSYLLHPREKIFQLPGYRHMPWISYMTLLTVSSSCLVFCWLKSDKTRARYLLKLTKDKAPREVIEELAYSCSDSLAIEKSHYVRFAPTIDQMIKNTRGY